MNDPHVERLIYSLERAENFHFESSETKKFEHDGWTLELDAITLTASPSAHFPTVQSAREVIEPYLEAWETQHALRAGGKRRWWFDYKDGSVIDRAPTPTQGSHRNVSVSASILSLHASGTATVNMTERHLPAPPSGFNRVSVRGKILCDRLLQFRKGREPLLSMAYYCLTVLEDAHGSRKQAAQHLNVEMKVLKRLGELSSTRGDKLQARKVVSNQRPLQPEEAAWLERVLPVLIERQIRYDQDANSLLDILELSDLE